MSVIGIDFGSESCYVAAAKAGGIETLANDYSLRATPSCVAFDGKKRIIGVAAKNQQVTNMKNTVSGFKRLLGRKFNDPQVQREICGNPTKVEQLADGNIGIRVNYLGQEQSFTPEQIAAMLFTKLKETSTNALQVQVNDCVITCPAYFTNAERKALLDAAQIAGLNVLRLLNETTATALCYGFYKQDLPEDKPRNVIFIDCGHSSLQVSACGFTKGKLKMIANAWDQNVGGRDFDAILAEYFIKEFQERYKLNVKSNARSYLRLLTEVEKLKKQMSANSTKLPLNIECFMNDIDVQSSIQRTDMEKLCANLFARVEATFTKLLRASKLQLDEIHSVEIVGGGTRIPAIKHLIEKVFGKVASTTLNQDESVSRGAALQCAIMSPAVRVRDFGVTDIQNYSVKVSWDGEGPLAAGEVEVYPVFHSAPFSRMLTMNRKDPFMLTLQYSQDVPYPDPIIGKWYIKDVKPNEKGEAQEVKIKVRINNHGIVLISSASLVEKKESEENHNQDMNNSAGEENQNPEANQNAESTDMSQEGSDKKKKSSKLVELPMDVQSHGYHPNFLTTLVQQEMKMIANDVRETERVDARNALEEFVYDMRNKLQGGPLERYVLSGERDEICNTLNEVENWLYEDGENCERDVYLNKLKSLQSQTDPIKSRAEDYEQCPELFEELQAAIKSAKATVSEFKKGSPKYDHLTETEFINISESADKAQKWLDSCAVKFGQAPRTTNSPVKANEIRQELQTLNSCVRVVTSRPKPKPAPKNDTKTNKEANEEADQQNDVSNKNSRSGAYFNEHPDIDSSNVPDDSTMEVE